MSRCSRCLLPSTYPSISFDERNVCNNCRTFSVRNYEGEDALNKQLAKIRSEKGDNDCLVCLSGGRDSSYLAFKAVNDWGLRPIAFSYDNGHMPDVTKANVKSVSEKLDIETIVFDKDVKRNRALFRDIFLAWIRHPHLGMIQLFCIGCRSGVNKCIPQICHEHRLYHILDGANYYEDTSYKLNMLGINRNDFEAFTKGYDILHLQIIEALVKEFARNPYYLKQSILINGARDFFRGFGSDNTHKIRPFFFEKYNEDKIMDTITNELGWEKPSYFPYSWRSDCDIALLKYYISYKIMGFSDYDLFLSNMIRDGMIDRKTAEERLQKINCDLNNSTSKIREILKSYGIDSKSVQSLFDFIGEQSERSKG